ncbi:hypothetical protein [Desulfobacter postgatei]|uniref:hypothetical protein n=1 Tax=Desulfobacter postgatei TaxID=2293 RepID=UPI00259B619C|nr:hypothetical protein [uncultured Desulfobacter sp.]
MAVDKNDFSDLSDHELVDAYGQTGDPWAFEMLKAEERRRTAEKALKQATTSNKIAIASLFIAFCSLIVAILVAI